MSDNKIGRVNHFLTWRETHTWINDEGTWEKVATWENNAGTWRCIQSPMEVSCAGVSDTDSGAAGSGVVSSPQASPTVTDLTADASLSYAWVRVSTSTGNSPTINNAAIATPAWSATVTDGTPSSSIWRLTVTDVTTGAVATVSIGVTLTWVSTS